MAHIYLINLPAHGHINPTLPLVRELAARGHRVSYYAGGQFREAVAAAGAEFREYAPPLAEMAPPANLFAMARLLTELEESLLPGLLAAAGAERPDLIIHDSMATWGKSLAALSQTPAICSTSTFAISPRAVLTAPGFVLGVAGSAVGSAGALAGQQAAVARLRRRYGLPWRDPLSSFSSAQPHTIVYTARALQPAPESFPAGWAFVGPGLPDAPPSDPLPLERRPGRPLIYVSLGTLFNTDLRFYRSCFAALGELDADVLIAIGRRTDPAALGAAPANVSLQPFVPQLAVLGQADLFVTHGGMNSVQEGLFYGVPLLVVPQAADQGLVGAQVARLGAGLALDGARLNPAALRSAAERLLHEPGFRRRAAAIGGELRAAGGAARAADLVEGLLPADLSRRGHQVAPGVQHSGAEAQRI